MAAKDLRVNERIRIPEVRLIDDKGEQRGIVPLREALGIAKDVGLDLVEVSPNAKPPVCKLLDYGKYKFEQEKKGKESKRKQKAVRLKEIRMQPKIDIHDLKFKAKHVKEFLEPDLAPAGRQIIECCLEGGSVEDYKSLINFQQ